LAEQWLAAAREALDEDPPSRPNQGAPGPSRRARGLLARVEQLEGNLAHARGQFHRASDHYRQACDAFVAAGEPGGQVLLWANLAGLALIGGDTSRGVEAGRRALAGQLARGRMQALPAIVANLVGLLVRVGALDEARVQVELLRGLLAAMQAPGEVADARLRSAEAEVLWARHRQQRPLDATTRATCAAAFATAATALAASGCTRESVASWLRAGMVERLGGRLEVAAKHREQARTIAAGLEDHTCELWLALEEIAWATKAKDRERFIRVCESLRLLTRPSELTHSGRLELALAYDRTLALALHHFYGADHPRTVAAAGRARKTLETMMNQIDPIDRQAVRGHQIEEADEPEVLRELLDPPAPTPERGEPTPVTPPGPTRRQSSRHERLIRIYRRLAREDELERLLVQVVDAMMELSDAERGVVVVSAPSAPAGERIQVARELAPGSEGVVYSRSVIESVLKDGRPILSVDAAEDDRFDGSRSVSHLNLRSVLAVPLVFRGEVLGAAYVDHRLRRGAFDETDLAHIEEFAELAALAVAHARTITAQRNQAEAL
ncbi:MAG: GAF domain-containing protein, partial [Nannocystaceae bacterium]